MVMVAMQQNVVVTGAQIVKNGMSRMGQDSEKRYAMHNIFFIVAHLLDDLLLKEVITAVSSDDWSLVS